MGDKRKDGNYIKLFRSIVREEWFRDDAMLRLWIYLLCTCNWKASRVSGRTIKPGQLVTTIDELSESIGIGQRAVIRSLRAFEELGEIRRERYGRGTLITILKWDFYQGNRCQIDNDRKTIVAQMTTISLPDVQRFDAENPQISTAEGAPKNIKELYINTISNLKDNYVKQLL